MSETKIEEPIIVAEIGCNHKGDVNIAMELIKLAHQSGAHYAKFQKRTPKELLTDSEYHKPHPVPYNSFGESYGSHREFLELDVSEHQGLKVYCEELGIGYATSVWDITSAKEIIGINPDYIKVPSACNNNLSLLKTLRDEYNGDIHISLGMTSKEEETSALDLFRETNQQHRLVLYACTSGYPISFDEACLLEIKRIETNYGRALSSIGYSGHHLGIAIDIAAYTLGARWIERHFTKDRTWKGTDHAASLEPAGMSKLVRDLMATHSALTYKEQAILEIEKSTREKLKFNNSNS